MGWAAGMQAGTQMARNWIDTYNQAREQRDIRAIQDEKPQQITAFDDSSVRQMEGLQRQGYSLTPAQDDKGNPQYYAVPKPTQAEVNSLIVTPEQAADYGLAPPRAAGAPSPGGLSYRPNPAQDPDAPRPRTFSAQPQYSYGDRVQDAEFSPEEVKRMQQERIAGVVSRYRPEQGLSMLNSLDANQRANSAEGRQADLHPYDVRAASQKADTGDINLDTLRTAHADEQAAASFVQNIMPQHRGATPMELTQIAEDYGLSPVAQRRAYELATGTAKGSLDSVAARVQSDFAGFKSATEGAQYYNDNVHDGVYVDARTMPDGRVQAVRYSIDEQGNKVALDRPQTFKDDADFNNTLLSRMQGPVVLAAHRAAMKQADQADQKFESGLANDRSQRALQGAQATERYAQARLNDRLPQDKSSFGFGAGVYKKGAQSSGWVYKDGKLAKANGVFDGTKWTDPTNKNAAYATPFIPAAELNLGEIDKNAAAAAKAMAGTPKQQTENGKVTKWTYATALEYQRQKMLGDRVDALVNGVSVGAPADAAAPAVDWAAPPAAAKPSSATRPAAAPAAPPPRPGGLGYDAIMSPQVAPQQPQRPSGAMQREWQRQEYERRRQAAATRGGQPLQR